MPEGIETVVEDGYATIEFVDRSKLGPGLATLLQHTPAHLIHPTTRPRRTYTVPEEYARAAGLLDGDPADAIVGEAPAGTEPPADSPELTPVDGDAGGAVTSGDEDPAPADADTPPVVEKTWPDGEPEDDWRRDELDDYALAIYQLDTRELKNKTDVLAAITKAKAEKA